MDAVADLVSMLLYGVGDASRQNEVPSAMMKVFEGHALRRSHGVLYGRGYLTWLVHSTQSE